MTDVRHCPQGHEVPVGETVCPVCGEPLLEDPPTPGRSLWDVMGQTSAAVEPMTPPLPELDSEPLDLDELDAEARAEDAAETMAGSGGVVMPKPAGEATAVELPRRCRVSAVLGVLAVPLAGLAIFPPPFWTRLPAMILGLAAVYTGLVGLGEVRATNGPRAGRGLAIIGIVLGTVGMFLFTLLEALG